MLLASTATHAHTASEQGLSLSPMPSSDCIAQCSCPVQVAMLSQSGDEVHSFSHTDMSPWSPDGALLLSQRVPHHFMQQQDDWHMPPAQIGFINVTAGELTAAASRSLADLSRP